MVINTEEQDWKKIQTKTFTKWINTKLNEGSYPTVTNLFENIRDGTVLAHLLFILTEEKFIYNKRPITRFQKVENIQQVLNFIKQKNITLINIGSPDIVDGNEKLILGLIWTIILRFVVTEGVQSDSSAKSALLSWCRACTASYKNVDIVDFSKSWQDGLGFNAIIHKFTPELIGDYNQLSKKNKIENLRKAFDTAENKLGIPKLFDPEDIAHSIKPDEKSIFTYVSQYYKKFSEMEKMDSAKKRLSDFLSIVNNSIKIKNEYEMEAKKFIELKNEFENNYSEIENLIETLNIKLGVRRTLSNEMNHKYLLLNSLLGNINTINNFYKIKKYEPRDEYKLDSLQKNILNPTYKSYKSYSSLMKEFEILDNQNMEYIKTLPSKFRSEEDIESQLKAVKNSLEEIDSSLKQTFNNKSIDNISLNEFETKKSLEFSKQIFLEKYEILKIISIKRTERTNLLNEATMMFKKIDRQKTGKINIIDFHHCAKVLGLITEDKDICLEKDTLLTLEEFLKCITFLYDQTFSLDRITKNIKIKNNQDFYSPENKIENIHIDELKEMIDFNLSLENGDIRKVLER
ncbi:alpha-actinin-like protein [Hamiltosporidium magnivora]|uniref:Alpha-actinin-like protein n=1 Tax=Hamiltosporidium magnivora TaxID=148818 RepID=A0A4Q9LKC4_9MICR|nr:alpha-actinin-like protein [Hamiltosporidium magnivora]